MSARERACLESGPPAFVEIPKPGGGARLLTVLSPAEGAAYERAVARLRAVIERTLGPRVIANRARPGRGIRLRPWRAERRLFERSRRALVGRGSLLVRADVRACYPSITSEAIGAALAGIGAPPDSVQTLRRILDRFAEDGVMGLPVGPDPSAVLANAVLRPLDDALVGGAAPHVRWVDDVWAAARDERHADELLERARDALAGIGLRLTEAKTRVVDRSEALDLFVAGSIEAYR